MPEKRKDFRRKASRKSQLEISNIGFNLHALGMRNWLSPAIELSLNSFFQIFYYTH